MGHGPTKSKMESGLPQNLTFSGTTPYLFLPRVEFIVILLTGVSLLKYIWMDSMERGLSSRKKRFNFSRQLQKVKKAPTGLGKAREILGPRASLSFYWI
jgi:hypothetical protein